MRAVRINNYEDARALPQSYWLYLAVFRNMLKVGVTGQLYPRLYTLCHVGRGHIDRAYAAQLPSIEARRRERLIARCFAPPQPFQRGRWTEWFGREHLTDALNFMLEPDDAEALLRRRERAEAAQHLGSDPRFEILSADLVIPVVRRAA